MHETQICKEREEIGQGGGRAHIGLIIGDGLEKRNTVVKKEMQ